nr:ATP-binding protein [Candidatus Fukatsuia symbiotica]
MVVTANQPFSAWEAVFSDKLMTVAAVDRWVHHAYIFEPQGGSYRKKTQ